MTIEAMKQALEALETADEVGFWELQKTAITSLRTAIERTEEPVAWGLMDDHGEVYDCVAPSEHAKYEGGYTVPLYTAPPAAQQEPVAWMIEWNGEPTGNLFRDECYATREMQRLNMLHPQDRRRLVPLYTTPPAALLALAERIEEANGDAISIDPQAAEELRRQHAEIERLRNDLAVYRGMVASVIVTAPAAADNLIEAYEKGLRDGAAQRQPLTEEEIRDFYGDNNNFELTGPYVIAFARAIEAAHGIGDKK
jgi:hypothetical protein